jgi:hypothetical protein
MLTSEQIEREVIVYVDSTGFRKQFATKSALLQHLAEQGTPAFYIMAAIDRLIDRGEIIASADGQRLTLRRPNS